MTRSRALSMSRYEQGQSLVEICVVCIALVPLAIGLVYVGQYIHIKQTVQQAAREAAWDAAISPLTYEIKKTDSSAETTRLRANFFAAIGATIDVTPATPTTFSDTLLQDYTGQQLLKPGQLTLSTYTNEQSPGADGEISVIGGKITQWISKIPGLNGGQFPPDENGYVTAKVAAKTAKAKGFSPFDKLDLDFHSQTALLADAWNADGSGEVDTSDESNLSSNGAPIPNRLVVNSLPPSAALLNGGPSAGLAKIFNFIGKIPIVNTFFPTDGLNFGRAAPDVVPYDKLQPYKE